MAKELIAPPLEVTGHVIGGIFPELQPYVVVRRCEGRRIFGLGPSALDEAIARGEIPKPVKFGKRASGWTGHVINQFYRQKAAQINAANKPEVA
ncbi:MULTISPECIES: hypothetical protein [unclassified Bradyrhizobium]|uniref:helix-turn-helix transcriptional regulator n=1 Tax=unclassified Bradyrhizobium TaxID=2631580 RepID=UPI0028E294FB|nr:MULTISPECIES: hypothetical protein [unclassified Bradyrhizobium]